ncbi:MAG: nitrogen fixation protein NifX [Nitrospirae bacterium]|nr:nitrogen fixation protein NifX [Nitrospirota bacterium]
MKVAFATADNVTVNEHFGRAGMFEVFEITAEGYNFFETRKFAEGRDTAIEDTKNAPEAHENLVLAKVDKLADCKIIYITDIGGPSAARLAKKGIMPVKLKDGQSIEESLKILFNTIKTSPPPWLKKVLLNELQK